MLLWMHEPADRDAMIIKHALRCVNPILQSRILAEIFCTKTAEEIHSITNAYESQNKGKSLLSEIESRVIDPPSREVRVFYCQCYLVFSSYGYATICITQTCVM